MLLSIVHSGPQRRGCIAATIEHLVLTLRRERIPYEIVAVDDGSSDSTPSILVSWR